MRPRILGHHAMALLLTLLASRALLHAQPLDVAGAPPQLDGVKSRTDAPAPRAAALVPLPDDKHPERLPLFTLLGRPLAIKGQLESIFEYRKDFDLDKAAKDDLLHLESQELELGFFYRLSATVGLFLQGKASYRAGIYAESGDRQFSWQVERDETWLYMSNLFGSRVSLQIGRQKFQDEREWWWDENLDAVRVSYNQPALHLALAVAPEVAPVSTVAARIDPESEKVLRVLGHVAWGWAKEQRLQALVLYQRDHSSRPVLGQPVSAARLDPRDADLAWFGMRTNGRLLRDLMGELDYWLDSAGVVGTETLFTFDDAAGDGRQPVASRRTRQVRGWAVDVGASWQTPLLWRPTLTVAYAMGSGERQPERRTDSTFRQTGLQGNETRWRGVNKFSYYGALLEPELANLHIWTAALGMRFLPSSSVELVYHHYRQVHAAPSLRNARIEAELTGLRRDVGQEWNLVIGVEEWPGIELQLVGALFRAGSAYGPRAGKTASNVVLEVNVKF